MKKSLSKNIFYLSLSLFFCGCNHRNLSTPGIDYNEIESSHAPLWILSGKIANPTIKNGTVIAASINGNVYKTSLSKGKFSLELPSNYTYALHFKLKDNGKNIFSTYYYEDSPDIGFKDVITLPSVNEATLLNLGEIDIIDKSAYSSINPSTIIDQDSDGTSDFADYDDQNDGLHDSLALEEIRTIIICHKDGEKQKLVSIPLINFYEHFLHKDTVGDCVEK